MKSKNRKSKLNLELLLCGAALLLSQTQALSAEKTRLAAAPAAAPVNRMESIAERALESEGAIFIDQNKVSIKAPLLTALIELHENQSPYNIDASGERPITLKDVLITELANNLDIKIADAKVQASRYNLRSTYGNFLPTLSNLYNYQTITGQYASPFGLLSNIRSPNMTIPTTLSWTFFNGGQNLYTTLQAKHQLKAQRFDMMRTTNDLLLEGANLYYQLALQDVLLQIRIKALETSEALLEKNQVQFKYGANTQLDVFQAETQMARDKQALISQQIARRKAAVALSTNLNLSSETDLLVTDRVISPMRLIDDKAKVADLVQVAIDNRPELKKWEQQRLAAKDAIRIAFAPLMPQVTGTGSLATTGAKVQSLASAGSGVSSAGTGAFGAGAFSTSTVASQGASNNDKKFNLAEIYQIGIGIQWNLGGMGLTDTAKVQSAKWQARQAQLEFARELTWVCKSVRDSYLDSLDAENLIAATNLEVNSARQQLKVAIIRLDEGVGTDLDVVNAQRDYTNALINKAQAIIQFNIAQVKLLRAMGRISVDNLITNKPIFR
ncbi:MAG: TolC family protein [Candidatus Obscuribacterales bacterium]|nr:TolC family protein [Candidatus Obscuribacterales bacterium]